MSIAHVQISNTFTWFFVSFLFNLLRKSCKASTRNLTHHQLNWQMKSQAWLLRLFVCLLSMKYPVMWTHQQMTFASKYQKLTVICSLLSFWRSWIWLGKMNNFYPRDAMLARVIEIATCLSVCPSVCPSRAGIVSKRRKLAAWFLHHLVAPRL